MSHVESFKHPPGAAMIDLHFGWICRPSLPNFYRWSKSATFGLNLVFEAL